MFALNLSQTKRPDGTQFGRREQDALNNMHGSLCLLRSRYGAFLQHQNLAGDVQCLIDWVEDGRRRPASLVCSGPLQDRGGKILRRLQRKLGSTADEVRHMCDDGSIGDSSFLSQRLAGAENLATIAMTSFEQLSPCKTASTCKTA